MVYTKELIEKLISCPKRIIEPPKKEMVLNKSHLRNSMKLVSEDGQYNFEAFIRVNDIFPENYSVGLVFNPNDGSGAIHLFRCNGPHGEQITIASSHHPHQHIHIATENNIIDGLRPEKNAIITNEYVTYQDAICFFVKKCGIMDSEKYFSFMKLQCKLPFEDGGNEDGLP